MVHGIAQYALQDIRSEVTLGNREYRTVNELVELLVLLHRRLEMAPTVGNFLEDDGCKLLSGAHVQ